MAMQGMIGEDIAIIATIDPQDGATSAVTSDWADMAKFQKVTGILFAGAITGTLDFKLQQATDSSGTGAVDITGASITQFAATDDLKQAIVNVEVDASNLDTANSFTFVAMIVTPTGGSTNLLAAVLLGGLARYKPVAAHDLASVAEIVNV